MRREYRMRRQALDGEIGLHDKLFFTEGEKKRLYLSFDYLFLTVCYLDLLSAECIRNVTQDSGWRERKRNGGRAQRPQKKVKLCLNAINDCGDKNANYQ